MTVPTATVPAACAPGVVAGSAALLPDYDPVVDFDGMLLGWDLHGHQHDADDVDVVIALLMRDSPFPEPDFEDEGSDPHVDFDVSWVWRRSEPDPDAFDDDDDPDQGVFVYYPHEVPGSTPVVRVCARQFWGRWCAHHVWEPATAMVDADRLDDGDRIVAEHVARQAVEVDPRIAVETHDGSWSWTGRQQVGGQVLVGLCADCYRKVWQQ